MHLKFYSNYVYELLETQKAAISTTSAIAQSLVNTDQSNFFTIIKQTETTAVDPCSILIKVNTSRKIRITQLGIKLNISLMQHECIL